MTDGTPTPRPFRDVLESALEEVRLNMAAKSAADLERETTEAVRRVVAEYDAVPADGPRPSQDDGCLA